MILSIIIPVYKVEKYISKTLESIAIQERWLHDVEIVVVNDGTPDNSMDIVNSFQSRIPNLVIINQKNGGLSNARNTGLQHASGKYVWFVDSDDWVEYHSLGRIRDRILTDGCLIDIYCYKIREYCEDGSVLFEREFPFETEHLLTGCNFLLSQISFTPMQQFILRRNFLLNNKLLFVEGIVHEDIEFAPRMLLYTDKVSVIPEVTYCYLRRTGDNITGSTNINENRLRSLQYILDEYEKLDNQTQSEDIKCCLKQVQCLTVYAIYGFASIDQIRSNFMDAFSRCKVKKYKRIIRQSIKYNKHKRTDVIWSLLFIISPLIYRMVSTKYASIRKYV